MTSPYVEKLRATTRCPVCGTGRTYFGRPNGQIAHAAQFGCSAVFKALSTSIVSNAPCPSGSRLAADHMNAEVRAAQQKAPAP